MGHPAMKQRLTVTKTSPKYKGQRDLTHTYHYVNVNMAEALMFFDVFQRPMQQWAWGLNGMEHLPVNHSKVYLDAPINAK